MQVVNDFVYQSPSEPEIIDKVAAMRQRIQHERGKEGQGKLDIKVGAGGLVDIEFLVQLHQLVLGPHIPALRQASTWDVLTSLEREGCLPSALVQTLRQDYTFLRRVESSLRIVDDRSINTIPDHPSDQRRLAKRLGYQDSGQNRAEEAMFADVQACTVRVRALYEQSLQDLRGRHARDSSPEHEA